MRACCPRPSGRLVLSGLRRGSLRIVFIAYLEELALEEAFSQLRHGRRIAGTRTPIDVDSDSADLEDLPEVEPGAEESGYQPCSPRVVRMFRGASSYLASLLKTR